MIKAIVRQIRLCMFKKIFRSKNKHNSVTVQSFFPIECVSVGKMSYGPLNILWMAPRNAKVNIGNYCSIGPSVTFLVGGEHDYNRISTWPFQTLIYHESTAKEINRDIVVEDDVWIGYGVLVLSGVTIGKGSVIGAGSVVAKSIPPYSIFVGNRVIKRRFSEEIIRKIEKIDYTKLKHKDNDKYKMFCQTEINTKNVDDVIAAFVNE